MSYKMCNMELWHTMTPSPQLTKEEQDILDFLILPSEFELSQEIAMEALDKIVASHSSASSEQQEFIITEEDLECLFGYFNSSDSKEKLYNLWNSELSVIHSRPAPSEQESREKVLDVLVTQLTKLWEEAKERSGEEDWDETHSFSLPYLKQIIEELRSKQGEP